jgi:hypothetical protein
MRGTVAKRLRREAFGDLSLRVRSYGWRVAAGFLAVAAIGAIFILLLIIF